MSRPPESTKFSAGSSDPTASERRHLCAQIVWRRQYLDSGLEAHS
jgi:hypothetical protein